MRRRRRSDTHPSDETMNAEKARILLALQKTNPRQRREMLERRMQHIEDALEFKRWIRRIASPPLGGSEQ